MGVLNVTPDSFSEGGRDFEPRAAIEHALELLDEGADILDIGGESTRPGAAAVSGQPAVSAEKELRRVMPVIRTLRQRPQAVVSIDTYKARVARAAVEAGAVMANDVSGLRWDPEMAPTLAGLRCGVVLMHMRGRPAEWRTLPPLDDPVGLVSRELREGAEAAVAAGIARERIVLDPASALAKASTRTIPCWPTSASCTSSDSRCWRASRGNRSSGGRWPAMAATPHPGSASTAAWPP